VTKEIVFTALESALASATKKRFTEEIDARQRRHATHYAELATELGARLQTSDEIPTTRRIVLEIENLRSAIAWSLDFLRYGLCGQRRLAWLIGISVWANWLLTLVASALGVRGLEYTRDPVNNVVAAFLDLFVVAPALVGAFAWAWGFGGRR